MKPSTKAYISMVLYFAAAILLILYVLGTNDWYLYGGLLCLILAVICTDRKRKT